MSHTSSVPLRHTLVPDSAVGVKFCDTIEIDQEAHRLYAGDNWAGGVDVFDIATPEAKYLKTIKTKGGFYGIAVAQDLNKVFVGLAAGAIGVIDIDPASPTMDTFVARTEFGARSSADLIEYVPGHRKVYAGMHGDRYVGVLDAVTHAVLGRIEGLGGNLEQPRYYPGDGMVYVASRTANALHQIDPTTDTLVRTFEIGVPCNPNGVAINPKTGQALLVSDNNQITVVWDLKEQKIASVIEESGAGDGAFYDPTIDRFFAAHSGFADGPVIGIFGGDPVRFLTNVPTQRGASWVAYDRTNGLVYAQAIQAGTPALISFPLPG
jgi:hypothetical protein